MKPFETLGGYSAFGDYDQAGACTYAPVKSGPDVDPDEVEDRAATSVEVVILWGTTVLHVQHLSPPRSFFVGDGDAAEGACDYVVPSEKLGTTRAPVVLVENGSIDLVVLPQAKGTIEMPGQRPVSIKDVIASGTPCAQVPGAVKVALSAGSKARVEMGGLVFQVAAVPQGKVPAHGPFVGDDTTTPVYVGLSLLAHAGLFAAMAFFVPPMGIELEEGASRTQRYLISHYMTALAERDHDAVPAEKAAETAEPEPEGGTGTRAMHEEGTMGNPNSTQTGHRYAVKGPADNPDPHVAREVAIQYAGEFGMISVLGGGTGGDPNAPTAPWGRDDSLGTDPISARGNMWGEGIGDSFGGGGWGLTGIGEGGGRSGLGAGLDKIGGLGRGAGGGRDWGIGRGGGGGPAHVTRAPSLRIGDTVIDGRIPAEVIQRIVRQNFGRFRLCYENGLRSNPNLQGRVEIRFVIGRDGAVASVQNGASDLPDAGVVRCVSQAYYGLTFPAPEGGIVKVVYPIMFTPGG